METNGSEYMIIKVDTKNGRIVELPQDEKGRRLRKFRWRLSMRYTEPTAVSSMSLRYFMPIPVQAAYI